MMHVQLSVWQFFGVIAVMASVCTVIRVLVLGDLSCGVQSKKDGAEDVRESSVLGAMSSAKFGNLLMIHVLVAAPCTALIGIVTVVGNAGGANGALLAMLSTVCNCAGRIMSGAVYDKVR